MKGTSPWFLVLLAVVTLAAPASARRASVSSSEPTPHISTHVTDESVRAELGLAPHSFRTASVNTTVLYVEDFDDGLSCTTAGWIEVDMTAQTASFFHVDDYAGLSFGPLRGTKSLWCGARPSAAYCSYATLPGYGNNWDQAFCTKACLLYTGTVAVDYLARWDTETGYDGVNLEFNTNCASPSGWQFFNFSSFDYEGIGNALRHDTFAAPASAAKLRIRFRSDGSWSDQDGLWDTNGALHVDSLSVSDGSGIRIAVEDFEGETVGATSANDWERCNPPGYGSPAFVTRGWGILQQDPCVRNLSCLWAFFENSTETYACGYFPGQIAVPRGNARGQYLNNEIWSPSIPLVGEGDDVRLQFQVYRDNPLDNLVFYAWHVRSFVTDCWGPWRNRNFVHFGGQKDWFTHKENVGDLLELSNGTHVQVALAVLDMCGQWCGTIGAYVPCHSQSPLFDNVKLLRLDAVGPQWSIRDIDQFQDNFAGDGTLTGTVRADMANSVTISANPHIIPGDSSVVTVADPDAGLANDNVLGGKMVYAYLAVWPQGQATKTGANLSGGTRWPFAGTQVIGGVTWTLLRLDQCLLNGNPVVDKFCVDFKDDLFTPGDTVCFFYGAENTNGVRTYAFGSSLSLQSDDLAEAATNAAEFTCLPAGAYNRGGHGLYVDGNDGRGSQPFWDTAFQSVLLLDRIDRYDVRGPTSMVANQPGGRVSNVINQLNSAYKLIYWDGGDISVPLGDGGSGDKSNDYGLLNTFLNNLTDPGGVYLCGDDVAQWLSTATGSSSITFRTTYLTYTLTSSNHRPAFGVSPLVHGTLGNCFTGDTFYVSGACPLLNDFDVMAPTGPTVMEASYGAPAGTNGAVLSKKTLNANSVNVGVILSGFSFVYIRDDDENGIMDRADHFHDVRTWMATGPTVNPTGTVPAPRNGLAQNYPNPFNPQTTIAFTLKQRGGVTLKVYNAAGELVRTLANESMATGPHTKVWNGRNDAGEEVSSGVYFYRLTATGFEQTKKMVLLK